MSRLSAPAPHPGVATGSRHRPGHASLAGCGDRSDAEDGNLRGDRLELLERGVAVDGDVRTGSRREREVAAQDRRPSLHGDVLSRTVSRLP